MSISVSSKLWVEKYRPKTIEDVQSQDEIIKTLSQNININNLPHLLFYGNPGTGKTSTILALARDMFGDTFSERVLELNASDERGIDVIRDKVKNFASRSINKEKAQFKLIILDEADSMTNDAQSALRRIIEKYTNVTRFCLICNYVSRIIEPLASRCIKYRFTPLPAEGVLSRLQEISDNEVVDVSDDSLSLIIEISRGDLRRAITLLQTASSFNDGEVTSDIILDISGSIDQKIIDDIWDRLYFSQKSNLINKIMTNKVYLIDCVDEIIDQGFSVSVFLSNLYKKVVTDPDMSDFKKAYLIKFLNLFYKMVDIN